MDFILKKEHSGEHNELNERQELQPLFENKPFSHSDSQRDSGTIVRVHLTPLFFAEDFSDEGEQLT
jgi:hypothetical protein